MRARAVVAVCGCGASSVLRWDEQTTSSIQRICMKDVVREGEVDYVEVHICMVLSVGESHRDEQSL